MKNRLMNGCLRKTTAHCFFIICLVLYTAGPACGDGPRPPEWAQPVKSAHLSNFFLVDQGLYRAAQPDRLALQELEQLGIKTVLNLRNFHEDHNLFRETKLHLKQVPINTWNITDDEIVAALSILKEKSNYPILVHCQHGADRTGTIIAMYRIVFQGWSKAAALEELTKGGFGFHPVWKNIPNYINGVDLKVIRFNLKLDPAA